MTCRVFAAEIIIMWKLLAVVLLVAAAQVQAKEQRSSSYESTDSYQQNAYYPAPEYVTALLASPAADGGVGRSVQTISFTRFSLCGAKFLKCFEDV